MKFAPSLLEPVFTPRLWGARSLEPLFPEKKNLAEPIGEVWLTGRGCRFASGPFAGKELGDAWQAMPPEWRGARLSTVRDFPLLVKFIFADNKLSIQVHPDDAYAGKHETALGGQGKTEMWYVVSARPGAEVLVGLNRGVDENQFRRALADGALEKTLQRLPAHAGDAFFVPAGTPHTIGPGMVLCEVQEYSDVTYRIFDYNRVDSKGQPRELHVAKALEVINFAKPLGGRIAAARVSRPKVTETYFVACRYFAAERWEFRRTLRASTESDHFDVLIFLEGAGKLHWENQQIPYTRAQAWLLPAQLGTYELAPESATTLLRAYVPDATLFDRRLAADGINELQRSRLIFP